MHEYKRTSRKTSTESKIFICKSSGPNNVASRWEIIAWARSARPTSVNKVFYLNVQYGVAACVGKKRFELV